MSVLARLTSGSAAAWVRIGVTFATQLAFVPVFLSHWDQTTYGVWLAIQALIGVTTLIDVGHQTFVGYEFLRLGPDRRDEIRRVFSASIPIGCVLGVFELIVVWAVTATGAQHSLLGLPANNPLVAEAGMVLVLQSVVWLLFGSVGGIAVRIVSPFGYYARFSWWGVFAGVLTSFAPAVAVAWGASLFQAGIVLAAATIAFTVPMFVDLWRLIRREGIAPVMPDWALGFRNLLRSTGLTFKTLFEMARQQGARIVLSPLAGAADMAAFATMRTGANIALQGLGTITNPLMPELMRFLNQRDQERSEAALGTVWLVVVAGMAPAVVVVQVLAPELFPVWTRGKIAFDGVLFALLSLGVLVYAIAQPPMAIVQGNNLLRPQLVLSALCGAVAVGGMFLLVPHFGLRGAAAALLFAEVVALIGYVTEARAWLGGNGLQWPRTAFRCVLACILVSGATMLAIAIWPGRAWGLAAIGIFLLLLGSLIYWRNFPPIIKVRLASLIRQRLPSGLRSRIFKAH